MKNNFVFLILTLLVFPHLGYGQANANDGLRYEVNAINPPLSIEKEQLNEAKSLVDLNAKYKSEWIREYISVEIQTSYKGESKKAFGKNNILSQKQKDNMSTADVGSAIKVLVKYIPKNNLKNNEAQELDFTFIVLPESKAAYVDGNQELMQYLKAKAFDKIPNGSLEESTLAAVKFAINEKGEVIDVYLYESSKDEKIDTLLIETIQNMPCWKPAEYADGTKVKQELALTVGNMESCVINLLGITRS